MWKAKTPKSHSHQRQASAPGSSASSFTFFSDRSCKNGRKKLRGLFLEAPRISELTAGEIFQSDHILPDLQVLSICRYSELLFEQLVSLMSPELVYLKIGQCDQFSAAQIKRLKNLISSNNISFFYEK